LCGTILVNFCFLFRKVYDCHVEYYASYPFIAASALNDACEEDDVLKPLDGVVRLIDSLALGCIIKLIERLPCPGLRLRFFKCRKNTDFMLEGV
jgi:hypothetical protein